MKKILTCTFLATCCFSSAFADTPAPQPIVATSATPPSSNNPPSSNVNAPLSAPDVPPQARQARPIHRIRRPVKQQETKEDDTPDPSAQSIQDALKKGGNADSKNNAVSSVPTVDNKNIVPVATFPDSDTPNEDDEGTVEPEIPQDISQCNGYVMHVKYMNGDKMVEQNDSCLSKGSHESLHVTKNFIRTGLSDKKYGWSFSVIPGNSGFYNDKYVTILGYYALPVDVVSGDQKNEDALLSIPVIQRINTDAKNWYELLPIDTGSNYHVMPLTIQVSFTESKSK